MVVEFTFSVLKALFIYACQERYLVEELCYMHASILWFNPMQAIHMFNLDE